MLQITDRRIVNFCEEHPSFSPEQVLLFVIDVIENVGKSTSASAIENMFSKLSMSVGETSKNIVGELSSTIMSSVRDFADNVSKEVRGGTDTVLQGVKNERDSLETLMKLFTEVQDNKLENRLQQLSITDLMVELDRIRSLLMIDSKDKENIMLSLQQEGLREMMSQLQHVVNPIMMARLNDIHEQHTKSDRTMEVMRGQLSIMNSLEIKMADLMKMFDSYLERYRKSSTKGSMAEIQLKQLLESMFPQHEVLSVPSRDQKGQMDLVFTRENYPNILFESKEYKGNVSKADVEKFERDIVLSGHHGIMISANSGIANRNNFQINRVKNRFAVYLCNRGLDQDDIRNAVQVLYSLNKFTEKDSGMHVDDETLAKLNDLIIDTTTRINRIKEHLTISLRECEGVMTMRMSELLEMKGRDSVHECEMCGKTFKNKGALGNHKKIH